MSRLHLRRISSTIVLASLLAGCGALTVVQKNQVAAAVLSGFGARSPAVELSQVYYLGVFDPADQVPPMLYRVRVRGQASALSATQFASGWVPAAALDSLTGSVGLDSKTGAASVVAPSDATAANLSDLGRRMIMFGPEGFREAPKNYRLAIALGSNPETFFQSVESALGTVALATSNQSVKGVDASIALLLQKLKTEATLFEQIRDAQ